MNAFIRNEGQFLHHCQKCRLGSLYQIHIESRSCKKTYVPHFLILKVTIFDRVVLEAERFQPWNDMF